MDDEFYVDWDGTICQRISSGTVTLNIGRSIAMLNSRGKRIAELEAQAKEERRLKKLFAHETLRWMQQLHRADKIIDRVEDSMNSTLDQLSYSDLRASGGIEGVSAIDEGRSEGEGNQHDR